MPSPGSGIDPAGRVGMLAGAGLAGAGLEGGAGAGASTAPADPAGTAIVATSSRGRVLLERSGGVVAPLVKFHVHVSVVSTPAGCRHALPWGTVRVLVPLNVGFVATSSFTGNGHSSSAAANGPLDVVFDTLIPWFETMRPCCDPIRRRPVVPVNSQMAIGAGVSGTLTVQVSPARAPLPVTLHTAGHSRKMPFILGGPAVILHVCVCSS